MKAVDKAKELVDRFKGVTRPFSKRLTLKVDIHPEHAKQSAFICVDEMLREIPKRFDSEERYWEKVKQEINKLN